MILYYMFLNVVLLVTKIGCTWMSYLVCLTLF